MFQAPHCLCYSAGRLAEEEANGSERALLTYVCPCSGSVFPAAWYVLGYGLTWSLVVVGISARRLDLLSWIEKVGSLGSRRSEISRSGRSMTPDGTRDVLTPRVAYSLELLLLVLLV